ncbi:MAG: hypothetical protein ACREF1_00475 [Acetobacteraceae bacterium]
MNGATPDPTDNRFLRFDAVTTKYVNGRGTGLDHPHVPACPRRREQAAATTDAEGDND